MDDIKDVNTSQDIQNVPITPEGIPIPVENTVENHGEIQLPKTEVEKPIETITPQEEPVTEENKEEPVSTIAPTPEPETINIVDKTEETTPAQNLEGVDSLSEKADEDEQNFIENVKTAHEHS